MTGRDLGEPGSAVDHILQPAHAQLEGMVRGAPGWWEGLVGHGM